MNGKSQTKEEQVKKKTMFDERRVKWLMQYMNDELPTLDEMRSTQRKGKLLTARQQQDMARLIQAGAAGKILQSEISVSEGGEPIQLPKTIDTERDRIMEILSEHSFTPDRFPKNSEQRTKLNGIVDDAWEARNIFAEKNLGLVTMIAGRRKRAGSAGASADFDDLVAEGMSGLMNAIDHFDPDMGNLFSTPAAWWIEQPIRNYLDGKTKTIHMPTHMNNIYKSIYYATKALRDKYSSDAQITDEMIAEYCQSTGRDITVEKIQEARKLRRETISYDVPLGGNGGNGNDEKSISEFIEDDVDVAGDIIDRIGGEENFERLLSLITDDKKREILRDWYTSNETKDIVILSNVSRKHCLTKDRTRQLKQEGEFELKTKLNSIAAKLGNSNVMNIAHGTGTISNVNNKQ